MEDVGRVVVLGDARAHLVLELAVLFDPLKVAQALLFGADSCGSGYAMLRPA